MKKLVFLFSTVLLSAGILSAQSFTKDTKILDLGVGVGGSYVVGKSTIPPVSVSFEKGITDKISIGGLVGYSGSNNDLGFGFKYTNTNILLGENVYSQSLKEQSTSINLNLKSGL